MARNNPKPGEKINWQAIGEIIIPSAARKLAGWLFSIKPAAQHFNWLFNLTGLQQFYSNAQVEDWIVIDSDADEGDYATLALYIADAPAAGNRILVKEDQTVTAQVILPANVTLKFLDGSRFLCATNIATSVLKLGSNPIIEGVLNIVLSHTGVTAKAVEIDGDNAVGKINVENSSTGTLTTGYHINASKTGNRIEGFIDNTGGGVLTNVVIDNSTENSNMLVIVDEANSITISTNIVDTFSTQTIPGQKTFSAAIIASGGVQTDGATTFKTKEVEIGDWNMQSTASVSVAHGIDHTKIRNISVVVRDDVESARALLTPYRTPATGIDGYIGEHDATNILLGRSAGGVYDNSFWNDTSYNRGWITITYIV